MGSSPVGRSLSQGDKHNRIGFLRLFRLFTKLWGQRRFCSWLSALSDNAKSIIVKVSKAVSAALDEFHFSVEAFGDAIVFSKAPHGGNRFDPGFEGLGEGH